jgi:hypothetical protein
MAEVPTDDLSPEALTGMPGISTEGAVMKILENQTVARVEEITDQLGETRSELYPALIRLLEDGKIALFPIGDSVQVRKE